MAKITKEKIQEIIKEEIKRAVLKETPESLANALTISQDMTMALENWDLEQARYLLARLGEALTEMEEADEFRQHEHDVQTSGF